MQITEHERTAKTRARYGRIAPIYDLLETLPELRFRAWREGLWEQLPEHINAGDRLLEIGVGTGKNMPYWPENVEITAIDLVPAMVSRARKRLHKLGLDADIQSGDAQELDFVANHFDAATATFVFCSVPDPLKALSELARAVKPGGHIFLLEHVRAKNDILGSIMDFLNPVMRSLMGPNINRDTVGNVAASPLVLLSVVDLDRLGIFKHIHARNPDIQNGGPS
jgi:ubiquinone/menaquinone biosynthesis C-methylase UbiE